MIDLNHLQCPQCSSDFLEEGNMMETGLGLFTGGHERDLSDDSDNSSAEVSDSVEAYEPIRRSENMMAALFRLVRGRTPPPRVNDDEVNEEQDVDHYERALQNYVLLMRANQESLPPAEINIESIQTISTNEEMKDIECKICEENFKADEEAKKLDCSHLFHANCLVPWLKIKNTCPTCRQPIDS